LDRILPKKNKKMQKFLSEYLTQADDLGRIVVPKEIRRTLRLREGTPLEIFTDREGEIILKKYSPMVELTAFAGQYAEAMSQSTGLMVCITDRDQVIAVAGGPKKDILQKNISRQLEQLINERQSVCAGKDEKNFIPLVAEELEGVTAQVVTAIICEGDAIGAVAILSREPRARFGEMEMKLASTAAGFLGRQMEG
jgi:AbrB family transcriptional regulator (stage V sporulation protein T)